MSGDEVTEELEALDAILEETIDVTNTSDGRPTDLAIQINPLTASEQEKQYVSLTLIVKLPPGAVQPASINNWCTLFSLA